MASARELLQWAESELKNFASADPYLDALILLSEATGLSRTHVLFRENIDSDEENIFRQWITRRKNFEPIQYITGRAYFRNLTVEVGPGVLIPRPESEELVSAVKSVIVNQQNPRILDLGSGSGVLALSIATEVIGAQVTALEKDPEALFWLKRNIALASANISIVQCDVADFDGAGEFDAVIANPPYIPDDQALPTDVMNFEPHVALFGGREGIDIPREFIAAAARALKARGLLVLEHHESHGERIAQLMAEHFTEVSLHYDLNQRPRWSSGVRR